MRFLARLCVFLALLWGTAAQAQVTVDAVGTDINNGAGAASPLTGTGPTISGSATAILVITVIQGASNVSTVKWGSQTLTSLGSIANANINPSAVLGFWGGVSPTTGAGVTVTVTYTGTNIVDALPISYLGSDTSSVAAAFPNLTTGTDPGTNQAPPWSLAVSSATNHLTEAVWINGSGSNTAGSGQTMDISNIFVSNNGLIMMGSHKAGAAGTVTQTASNVTATWSGIIVDIATPATSTCGSLPLLGVGC